eukprot:CAMPEP_0201895748 /NCGR_PEP_ID=MMETSP0902-20130614/43250_1 /ASSEMBLY_ACC=CAM_ASM_000551 /TAXON_ID=420261 /ORGANISM="Thalassiosira antarctica, Strain CCMP982" /LENGTH=262 /DNA_ID=CAMNT_0048428157 /DNA_START=43 /DNA_END=831 /DNA_ORIENTATION=+
MNATTIRTLARGVATKAPRFTPTIRLFSAAPQTSSPGLPDSITRVAAPSAFPNEYPGQNYIFNWCLNADGVTPLKKSAFRIAKPLDLKVAGLALPKTSPLKVNAKGERSKIPEAGSDGLDFDTFDEALQSTKDALSLSDSLFCPEGHSPGTRTGVRIISNMKVIAPDLVAYLDRAPKRDPKSQPITCYVLSGVEEFSGYAIEEVEETMEDKSRVAVSVATVVVTGKQPSLERVVAGIELSMEGLEADAKERAEKKAAEEKAE